MKTRYQNLLLMSIVIFNIFVITTGLVYAQNFSGIVQAEDVSSDPLSPEPVATSQNVTASTVIPEEISNMSHYTVGATDILEITAMRHPEVSGQFVINNEGNIKYEFVGDLQVAGFNKDQIKKLLTEKLSEYIIDPDLTVKIVGYNSKIIYVVGEVGRPGKIFMQGDTMTVHQALIEAGLPLLSAKTKAGRVITPSNSGNPIIRNVNVEKLLYNGDLRENLVMKPGDTLYVPPTFLAKTMRAIQPIAAPIGTAAGTGRTVMTGF